MSLQSISDCVPTRCRNSYSPVRAGDNLWFGWVQPADLAELLEHGADIVVLSRGRQLRLETTPDTLSWLAARQVEGHFGSTEQPL